MIRLTELYRTLKSRYHKYMTRDYAFIGDIHSQSVPLEKAINHCHSRKLTPVFLGDLFDSRVEASDSAGVYKLVKESQKDLNAIVLRSNHQNKFERFARGNNVRIEGSFSKTLRDFKESKVSTDEVYEWLNTFPYGIAFKSSSGKEYRCAHAMFPSWVHVPSVGSTDVYKVMDVSRKARDYMLYGPRDAENRIFWWERPSDRQWVRVAGHYHTVHISENNLVLDGNMGGSEEQEEDSQDNFLCLWEVESARLLKFT